MSKLEILRDNREEQVLLSCSGRLDATSTDHLTDYLDRLVREGKYYIALDLSRIDYLSSAGIRALVVQYKNLNALNGRFSISALSENVKEVLDMVGMTGMFVVPEVQENECAGHKEPLSVRSEWDRYAFHLRELNAGAATAVTCCGQPSRIVLSDYSPGDTRQVFSGQGQYALGLGAIGDSYEACRDRFGEYILFNGTAAYLPADGSKKPDYLISRGKLVASLTEVYGLHFTGPFSHRIQFEPQKGASGLEFSALARQVARLTGYGNWAFVMIAESAGLIGTSLNASPVGGRLLFTYPEIRETVRFTTEPTHLRMQTISAGVVSNEPPGDHEQFMKPLNDKFLRGHVHTAVFHYIPLKKNDIVPDDTIDHLLNNAGLIDLLHLIADDRPLSGLGESRFLQGVCWIVPVECIYN
jgi:anti-sigma B factor antagonist